MMHCIFCGRKESKTRILVNNVCPECLVANPQPNIATLDINAE